MLHASSRMKIFCRLLLSSKLVLLLLLVLRIRRALAIVFLPTATVGKVHKDYELLLLLVPLRVLFVRFELLCIIIIIIIIIVPQ